MFCRRAPILQQRRTNMEFNIGPKIGGSYFVIWRSEEGATTPGDEVIFISISI